MADPTKKTSTPVKKKLLVITPDKLAKMGLSNTIRNAIAEQMKKSTPSKTPETKLKEVDNKAGSSSTSTKQVKVLKIREIKLTPIGNKQSDLRIPTVDNEICANVKNKLRELLTKKIGPDLNSPITLSSIGESTKNQITPSALSTPNATSTIIKRTIHISKTDSGKFTSNVISKEDVKKNINEGNSLPIANHSTPVFKKVISKEIISKPEVIKLLKSDSKPTNKNKKLNFERVGDFNSILKKSNSLTANVIKQEVANIPNSTTSEQLANKIKLETKIKSPDKCSVLQNVEMASKAASANVNDSIKSGKNKQYVTKTDSHSKLNLMKKVEIDKTKTDIIKLDESICNNDKVNENMTSDFYKNIDDSVGAANCDINKSIESDSCDFTKIDCIDKSKAIIPKSKITNIDKISSNDNVNFKETEFATKSDPLEVKTDISKFDSSYCDKIIPSAIKQKKSPEQYNVLENVLITPKSEPVEELEVTNKSEIDGKSLSEFEMKELKLDQPEPKSRAKVVVKNVRGIRKSFGGVSLNSLKINSRAKLRAAYSNTCKTTQLENLQKQIYDEITSKAADNIMLNDELKESIVSNTKELNESNTNFNCPVTSMQIDEANNTNSDSIVDESLFTATKKLTDVPKSDSIEEKSTFKANDSATSIQTNEPHKGSIVEKVFNIPASSGQPEEANNAKSDLIPDKSSFKANILATSNQTDNAFTKSDSIVGSKNKGKTNSQPADLLKLNKSKPEGTNVIKIDSKPADHLEQINKSKSEEATVVKTDSKLADHLNQISKSKFEEINVIKTNSKLLDDLEENNKSNSGETNVIKTDSKPADHLKQINKSKSEETNVIKTNSKPLDDLEQNNKSKSEETNVIKTNSKPADHLEQINKSKSEETNVIKTDSKPSDDLEQINKSKSEETNVIKTDSKLLDDLEQNNKSKSEETIVIKTDSKPSDDLEQINKSKSEETNVIKTDSKPANLLIQNNKSKPEETDSNPAEHLDPKQVKNAEPNNSIKVLDDNKATDIKSNQKLQISDTGNKIPHKKFNSPFLSNLKNINSDMGRLDDNIDSKLIPKINHNVVSTSSVDILTEVKRKEIYDLIVEDNKSSRGDGVVNKCFAIADPQNIPVKQLATSSNSKHLEENPVESPHMEFTKIENETPKKELQTKTPIRGRRFARKSFVPNLLRKDIKSVNSIIVTKSLKVTEGNSSSAENNKIEEKCVKSPHIDIPKSDSIENKTLSKEAVQNIQTPVIKGKKFTRKSIVPNLIYKGKKTRSVTEQNISNKAEEKTDTIEIETKSINQMLTERPLIKTTERINKESESSTINIASSMEIENIQNFNDKSCKHDLPLTEYSQAIDKGAESSTTTNNIADNIEIANIQNINDKISEHKQPPIESTEAIDKEAEIISTNNIIGGNLPPIKSSEKFNKKAEHFLTNIPVSIQVENKNISSNIQITNEKNDKDDLDPIESTKEVNKEAENFTANNIKAGATEIENNLSITSEPNLPTIESNDKIVNEAESSTSINMEIEIKNSFDASSNIENIDDKNCDKLVNKEKHTNNDIQFNRELDERLQNLNNIAEPCDEKLLDSIETSILSGKTNVSAECIETSEPQVNITKVINNTENTIENIITNEIKIADSLNDQKIDMVKKITDHTETELANITGKNKDLLNKSISIENEIETPIKKRRGRKRKIKEETEDKPVVEIVSPEDTLSKRRRSRNPKYYNSDYNDYYEDNKQDSDYEVADSAYATKKRKLSDASDECPTPKRRVGRPRKEVKYTTDEIDTEKITLPKNQADSFPPENIESQLALENESIITPKKRGRPSRKNDLVNEISGTNKDTNNMVLPKQRGRPKSLVIPVAQVDAINTEESTCDNNTTTANNDSAKDENVIVPKKRGRRPKSLVASIDTTNTEESVGDNNTTITNEDSTKDNLNDENIIIPKKRGRRPKSLAAPVNNTTSTEEGDCDNNSTITNEEFKTKKRRIHSIFDVNDENNPARILNLVISHVIHDIANTALSLADADSEGICKSKTVFKDGKKIRMVICALCKQELKSTDWNHHKLKKHNNLAWKVGEKPMDLHDVSSVMKIFNGIYKLRKSFCCDICNEYKKSLYGFLAHRLYCGNTSAEEIDRFKIECPDCSKQIIVFTYAEHERAHRNKKQNESFIEDIPNNLMENDGTNLSKKRNAAKKATELIQSCSKEEEGNFKLENLYVKNEFFKFNFKTCLSKELKDTAVAKCRFKQCKEVFESVEAASLHIKNCTFVTPETYICKLCSYVFKTKDKVKNHIKKQHKKSIRFDDNDYDGTVTSEQDDDDDDDDEDDLEDEGEGEGDDEEKEDVEKYEGQIALDSENLVTKRRRQPVIVNEAWKAYCLVKIVGIDQSVKEISEFLNYDAYITTLEYCKNNYEKMADVSKIFIKCDFTPLNPTEIMGHLPKLKLSVPLANAISSSKTIDSNNLDFKMFKLFESVQNSNGSITTFCGGPVNVMSWAPTPYNLRDCDQILAVAPLQDPDKLHYQCKSYIYKGIIQFWNYGKLKVNESPPSIAKLEFCLAHNLGAIWSMEWCPSGCYEHKGKWLGLLAVTSTDSNVYGYSIPHSNQLKYKFYKPNPTFQLKLQSSDFNLTGVQYQALRISWTKASGHQYIAVGYSNGLVALFDIKSVSGILRNTEEGLLILYPYLTFQAHSYSISGLALYHLNGGNKWLLTSSIDSHIKLWNLENVHIPACVTRRSQINNLIWLNNYINTIESHDEFVNSNNPITSTPIRFFTSQHSVPLLYSSSPAAVVSATEWSNIVIQGTGMGEIMGCRVKHYFPFTSEYNLKRLYIGDTIPVTMKNTSESEVSRTEFNYNEIVKKNGLIFVDHPHMRYPALIKASEPLTCTRAPFNTPQFNKYPLEAINSLVINPNRYSFTHVAVGYQVGFTKMLHLKCFSK